MTIKPAEASKYEPRKELLLLISVPIAMLLPVAALLFFADYLLPTPPNITDYLLFQYGMVEVGLCSGGVLLAGALCLAGALFLSPRSRRPLLTALLVGVASGLLSGILLLLGIFEYARSI